jgi:hypothetical protein
MAAADPNEALAVLEPRALRQFTDPDFQGPKIYVSPKAFEEKVGESSFDLSGGGAEAGVFRRLGSYVCGMSRVGSTDRPTDRPTGASVDRAARSSFPYEPTHHHHHHHHNALYPCTHR